MHSSDLPLRLPFVFVPPILLLIQTFAYYLFCSSPFDIYCSWTQLNICPMSYLLSSQWSWIMIGHHANVVVPAIIRQAIIMDHLQLRHVEQSSRHDIILNSFDPNRCGGNFESVISKHMSWIEFISISCVIALRLMPQIAFDDKST